MAVDGFSNAYLSTLNGSITNVATSLVITSTTGAPSTVPFRIRIKAEGANTNEICTVTAVSGTTWTISRASEAYAGVQTASAHASGATVEHVLTAGGLMTLATATAFIGCKVYHDTTQSVSANAVVLFNSEEYDSDGFHSTSSNTSRVTIPAGFGGKYAVSGGSFSGTTTRLYMRLNGATVLRANGTPSNQMNVNIGVIEMAAGDYIEMLSDGTATHGDASANNQSWMSVVKMDSGKVGQGIGVRRTNSATQTVSAATEFTCTYDTLDFDTDSFHTGSGVFTIPAGLGGKYLIQARVYMDGTAGSCFAYIRKNGAGEVTGSSDAIQSNSLSLYPFAILNLNAGDTIQIRGYRTTGTTTGYADSQSSNAIQIMRLDSGSGRGIGSTRQSLTRSAGALTLSGSITTHVEVSSVLRLSIAARVGDVLMVGLNGLFSAGASGEAAIDSATIVSGAIVNRLTSAGARTPGHGYSPSTSAVTIAGTLTYVVQAGDISGGLVTLSPTYMNSSASVGTLYATTTYALYYWVINFGQ